MSKLKKAGATKAEREAIEQTIRKVINFSDVTSGNASLSARLQRSLLDLVQEKSISDTYWIDAKHEPGDIIHDVLFHCFATFFKSVTNLHGNDLSLSAEMHETFKLMLSARKTTTF